MVLEYFCIIFLYGKVVHGREFLGGPCNEVHGTILVIILRHEAMCVCLFVCLYTTFSRERCKCFLRLAACT